MPDLVARVRGWLETTDPKGYVGACAALRDADLRTRVADVVAPALLVTGDDDASTPPADARSLGVALADSSTLGFAGVGHLPNLECPGAFTTAVVRFLEMVRNDP